jgi:DNA-binding transcriptional MerR regulator
MFSRASLLSIKTLRAYHEAGILVPAQVDRFTGYRMYTADQLADAAIVRRLRALDVPLEQVRQILRARDPDFTRAVLANHQAVMQARLTETERIVAELQSGVAPITHTPIHVRPEAAVHSLSMRASVKQADLGDWVLSAVQTLLQLVELSEVTLAGAPGTLYDPEFADDEGEAIETFVPISEPIAIPRSARRDVMLSEVPAAHVAVLMHAGDYASLPDTYRTLGAWVARHAQPSGARIREWYRVAPWDTYAVDAFRTEVAWPIRAPADC